ncbi:MULTISPECIES: dihydrofolate reductase [unclassified Enterococcus]|uniref:dihydrofolate reductase n=1 Tax=unclassified Enterococcus TaxID=2608891 RepID=UPI0006B9A238|nr:MULTISPECIES: dihydrofolate reductase [unclassified Enterococcus]KPG69419.1 dihydrofolate reductase [Enterococcus sp. RIT-PI-f]
MLIALWAQDNQGLIGENGTLPWHLPNDLKFFKEQTIHNTIIMGRKTFEGMDRRPLPQRTTIVLTKDPSYQAEGVLVMHDREEVLAYANAQDHPVFLTGGAGVFKTMIDDCDQLYRTVIDERFTGDVFFPAIDWEKWQLTKTIPGIVDDRNKYRHRFEFYQKK